MAELDALIAGVVVFQAAANIVYLVLRLRNEARKVRAAEASAASNKSAFDSMTVYHAERLKIEEAKLELARRNER